MSFVNGCRAQSKYLGDAGRVHIPLESGIGEGAVARRHSYEGDVSEQPWAGSTAVACNNILKVELGRAIGEPAIVRLRRWVAELGRHNVTNTTVQATLKPATMPLLPRNGLPTPHQNHSPAKPPERCERRSINFDRRVERRMTAAPTWRGEIQKHLETLTSIARKISCALLVHQVTLPSRVVSADHYGQAGFERRLPMSQEEEWR
ncbi:hypothetical protein C8R46DRAFT_1044500 [Mycena filopes]|nr:hypothetical protein C8R46DRAFT_1044500 [Mycena filopes]